ACGPPVHKPVDNRRHVRITCMVLWTSCGGKENSKRMPADSCATLAEAVEMLSPLETGTTWGHHPGDAGESGKPDDFTGVWPRRAARGSIRGCEAGRGPLHLIHGGGLV